MDRHIKQVKRELLKDWDGIREAAKERIRQQGHDIVIILEDERNGKK
ncbi:hypothetical protein [Velocimicrobium porci]|nr:hypothetical protein [Velocimicrobium porci]DAN97746.1 MAG TPA: hypothetical protein [Caudoviricetes sp.]